jgi:hypothetical protein
MVGSKVDYDISNLYIPKDGKRDIDYQKSFSATLTIIVRDKEGNVIKRYKQKSHSPTANFIGLMLPYTWYNATGSSFTIKNTSNSGNSYSPTLSNYGVGLLYPSNASNINTYLVSISVGSGSNSNPYSAYNLNAPISNGSGTGQLIYSTPNIPTGITINGNQAYFIISQLYTNQSSGTITISEVGIIIYLVIGNTAAGSASYRASVGNVLVWYDVLSSPISVSNGQQVVIYYTFTVNA